MSSLKKEIDKQKKRDTKDAFWITLILGIILIAGGIVYNVKNIIKIGVSLKYLQPTVLNASIFYLLGITFLVISYFLYKETRKKTN